MYVRKWEYKVIELPDDRDALSERLNSLGDHGWELVDTWQLTNEIVRLAILKRPAPGLPQC